MNVQEKFPDGTVIDEWFYDTEIPALENAGTQYNITDYGILPDGRVYTEEFQRLIDLAADDGGGVIVVPAGVYTIGAVDFKQGVSLYICAGGTLRGSDDISDYPPRMTRIEGETCMYCPALINADGVDGFKIFGEGTIDGNGLRAWKAFWIRKMWNPDCTNKDEQRPRLLYISNSSNVTIAGVNLINSHYWTTHIYKCSRVKYIGCRIMSPFKPVPAPSTDAIDIDACSDVLIKNCYFAVNDDSVVLKGGKGPWADTADDNGSVERIIVEDCEYGFCHGCLTCGSEAVHCKNIIVRGIKVKNARNLIWLKMRPDTPQHYEYISVEDSAGEIESFINIHPWTQFFDLKGRADVPLSYADNIYVKNCSFKCKIYFDAESDESQYILSNFCFDGLRIDTAESGFDESMVKNMRLNDVSVTVRNA